MSCSKPATWNYQDGEYEELDDDDDVDDNDDNDDDNDEEDDDDDDQVKGDEVSTTRGFSTVVQEQTIKCPGQEPNLEIMTKILMMMMMMAMVEVMAMMMITIRMRSSWGGKKIIKVIFHIHQQPFMI